MGTTSGLLLVAALLFNTPQEGAAVALEREWTAAFATGRAEGLAACGERLVVELANRPEDPGLLYLRGLGELLGTMLTNGAPDRTHAEATAARLRSAEADFERLFEDEGRQVDALAGATFSLLQRFNLGQAEPQEGAKFIEWITRGRALEPSHAGIALLGLWLESGQNPTLENSDAIAERFSGLAAEIAAAAEAREGEPRFWELLALGLSGRALLFLPRPRPRLAGEVTGNLLRLAPRFPMARDFLGPFVRRRTPLDPQTLPELDWEEVLAELDPDGATPGFPEAMALSMARTSEALFLRVHLAQAPESSVFGLNLVIDDDGEPGNGRAWWGGNREFHFDRLVTAWMARDDHGDYRGALGVTDADHAFRGEMTTLDDDVVGFAVEVEEQAYLLRIPWSALGGTAGARRAVVAVGTNGLWNDDLPNQGSFGF